ncbi:hypothetical protein K1719_017967 [Acacia pycnantha]|nr:hypothetical protein K1719_017967 [Acacia pycnantha]
METKAKDGVFLSELFEEHPESKTETRILTTSCMDIEVNPLAEVMEKLKKADEGNNELIREDNLFLTVGEAVASLSSMTKGQASNMEEGAQAIPHF